MLLCRYVDKLMQDVGSPASLKPPVPPLTRYKRDVAVKLQSDSGSYRQYGSTRPASMLPTKCATQPTPCVHSRKLFMTGLAQAQQQLQAVSCAFTRCA